MAAAPRARVELPKLAREQQILLGLLFLSICINYIDRGSLSVAQSFIRQEFGIDPAQLGMIFSAFYWTYATVMIVSGHLVDRFDVNKVFAVGYLVWSVAMLCTGLSAGLASLLVCRLFLGAGESVAYPAYSRILAASYREDQRGFANALIDAGSKAGPALGVLLGGLLILKIGWRAAFVAMGVASLFWLWPWLKFSPRSREAQKMTSKGPPLRLILRERSAWGTFTGLLCSNYAWYFMVFWLPPYFVNERHFSIHDMALLGSIPFWGVAVTSIASGWLSDRWISRGGSPTVVRKTMLCTGLLTSTMMLPAVLVQDNTVSLILLSLACASFGIYSSNAWALTQTLAGPTAAGTWSGVQNALGNTPGMFGLWFTGWVIQVTGHYVAAFAIASGFLFAGALSYLFIVGRVEPVDWRKYAPAEPQSVIQS